MFVYLFWCVLLIPHTNVVLEEEVPPAHSAWLSSALTSISLSAWTWGKLTQMNLFCASFDSGPAHMYFLLLTPFLTSLSTEKDVKQSWTFWPLLALLNLVFINLNDSKFEVGRQFPALPDWHFQIIFPLMCLPLACMLVCGRSLRHATLLIQGG